MNEIAAEYLLFADQGLWKELGSGFQGEKAQLTTPEIVAGMLVIVGMAALLLFLSRMMKVEDRRRSFHNPAALFKSLCAAHNLSRAEQRLLHQMAGRLRLDPPALVFVQPEQFEAADQDAAFKSQRQQLTRLKGKLFDGAVDVTTSARTST